MLNQHADLIWTTTWTGLLDVGLIVLFGMLAVHSLLGFRSTVAESYSMFECGFDGLDYANESLDCEIIFFILMFLVFDLELVILVYWFAGQQIAVFGLSVLGVLFAVVVTSSLLEAYSRLIDI